LNEKIWDDRLLIVRVGKSDRADLAVRNSAKECDDTLIVAAQSAEYLRLLDVLIAKAARLDTP
jgi:hypothetical protein